MPDNAARDDREVSVETGEASAGGAQQMDPGEAQARAETPDLLPREALDQRQAAISERRRRGGPPLDEETDQGVAAARAPDVPPTDCADPSTEETTC